MSSTCLARQISLLNSPRFVRSFCVSCECFANSHGVWSQRKISEPGTILNFFFHNSILEYINVAIFV